ncbi:MAG TPA: hypothetical protein VF490_17185, partial [Chryseosolibacter sp.]
MRVFLLAGFIFLSMSVLAQQAYYDVAEGNGNGIRFWQSDNYKIHMGNSSEYLYGPVTDYSIKMNMRADAGRGWTWGISGSTPVAALNNVGDMQLAGRFTITANSAPINFTSIWAGSPDNTTNVSEISNDMGVYKQLMVVGNKAQGFDRRVGIWDRLSIGGAGFSQTLNVSGGAYFSGSIGIGTSAPDANSRLHLFNPSSNTYLNIDKPGSTTEGGLIFSNNASPIFYLWSDNSDNDALKIETTGLTGENDGAPRMEFPKINKNIYMVESGGNVGIGTTAPNERLTVNGTIYGKEVKVDLAVPGPDYVFFPDYELPTLEAVADFIKANGHLPDVPSAGE